MGYLTFAQKTCLVTHRGIQMPSPRSFRLSRRALKPNDALRHRRIDARRPEKSHLHRDVLCLWVRLRP